MSQAMPIVSAGFSLAKGIFGAKAKKTQAAELEYQAKIEGLRGKQTAANQRQELNTALNTIEAIRATRNVGLSYGSSVARQKSLDNADTTLNSAVLSSNLRADSLRRGAKAQKRAANFSLLNGIYDAGSTLADTIVKSQTGGLGG